ncbi:MAG: protein kinase domain-containing protein [Terriglobales bacterium]
MPLTTGSKLGPYEVQSPLGEGGMGEVYCALDTRLNRRVAIKVLASHLASSPELKERMEREARAISALNHPHICHLYDIGSQDGADYLVMELLEGENLAERLRKGALPLNDILKIGSAIAEALAAAHRQGIVHRDLKPANIMLTPAGAKLMDFGLAKPLLAQTASAPSGTAPSFTAARTTSGPSPLSPLTTAGSIVGTIQYMSPEQIEGKEADPRSDIFAFGAVLYEMATGKRAFHGKSQISLASSILESDPEPITASQPLTPSAFEHVVTTCLQKSPDERYQTAHDIRIQLQWIASGKSGVAGALPAPAREKSRRGQLVWTVAVLALLLAALGALLSRPAKSVPSIRTAINPPEKTTLNLSGDSAGPPVLSPDGTQAAFTATGSDGKIALWVRPMNSLEAHPLADTDGATFPFWSPDGRSLGFFADGKLKTIDITGGSAVVVADAQLGRGGAWGPGGMILFSPLVSAPIMRVSSGGGNPAPVTKLDANLHTSHRWPFILPDGKHFLYLAIHHDTSKAANNALYYASLDGRENRLLLRSQSNAIYADGFLMFARGDQLLAQAFDPGKGTLSGEPRIVARGVMNDSSTWHMDASASDGGLLIFGTGSTGDLQLVWYDRATKQATVIADKVSNLQSARLSPQGDRIALQIDSGANDIWVLDLARGVRTRLTFGPVANVFPAWSPDGQWIAYVSNREGRWNIYRRRSDGSGGEETLMSGNDQQLAVDCWSRDGKYLLYSRREGVTATVWALPLQGERKPSQVLPRGNSADLSPDGHWLAYQSVESGTNEIYVVPFGGGQGKWQVSANGGQLPGWSRDGKELFYFDLNLNFVSVPVSYSADALQFGAAQMLPSTWSAPNIVWDISPDSKKILLNRVAQQVSQSVTVVTNFTEGLKK